MSNPPPRAPEPGMPSDAVPAFDADGEPIQHHGPAIPAQEGTTARPRLTDFRLAGEVQDMVAWLLAWRGANNDAERNAAVLSRAVRFLRGERDDSELHDVLELTRNDATCAAIYTMGQLASERRHANEVESLRSQLASMTPLSEEEADKLIDDFGRTTRFMLTENNHARAALRAALLRAKP